MQEELNEKVLSLCISGGRISEKIFKDAVAGLLGELERERLQDRQKAAEKKQEAAGRRKQSLKKMVRQGCQLSSIEVADGNIKSFEKCARKYHVGYSLMKDKSASPPRYYVFFKAKDVDVMTAAFRKYTGKTLERENKPSVLKPLAAAEERVAGQKEREREKNKERGPVR